MKDCAFTICTHPGNFYFLFSKHFTLLTRALGQRITSATDKYVGNVYMTL